MKPRIGIYFHARKSSGGIYQYSLTLLSALASVRAELPCDVVVFHSSPDFPRDEFGFTGWQFVFTGHRVAERIEAILPQSFLQNARLLISIIEQLWTGFDEPKRNIKLRRVFEGYQVDLMIYPSPRRESFESGIPYVVMIHDIQHRLQPHFPEVSRFGEWKRREYVFKNTIEKASAVIAESEVGKEHIIKFYHAENTRVKVLPYVPAIQSKASIGEAEIIYLRNKYALPADFIFYPAQFWPHKNHYRLVQAIKLILEQKGIRISTVFVGSPQRGWGEFQKVKKLVRREGLEGVIHYLNYVPPSDIPLFYRAAKFLVMPTFFGPTNIPVLEAFQLGCPVITSDIQGIREQVGEAALLADPTSVEDIAKKIHQLWTDEHLCSALVRAGAFRSKEWTINDFAGRVREIIQEVLSYRNSHGLPVHR
jgi:glycosyltransferase involved in cell wall biosynthesis